MSACRKSGAFPCPGAPNYRHNHGSDTHPKGWSYWGSSGNGSVRGVVGCGSAKGSRSCSAAHSGHSIVRAASMNGWPELLDSPSLNSSQDDENNSSTKEDFPVPPVVPTKDVATQMSPNWSSHPSPDQKINSSPKSLPSPSSTSNNVAEQQSLEYQTRDVQIDDRITISRWSKKHTTKGFDKDSTNIIKWKKKIIDSKTSAWETTGTVQCRTK